MDGIDTRGIAQPWVRAAVLLLGIIALAIVVAADYLTSYELRLSTLYMLVMPAVAWFCGPCWGGLFAFISAFSQVQIGLTNGSIFSEPAYFYISNANRLFGYLVTVLLVAMVRSNYTRLKAAARIDTVTGVANSLGFYEKLLVEMARHHCSRAPFAVACLNCDHFKVVNEGLGRSAIACPGGDEFALVFPQTSEAEALQTVRKRCAQFENAMTRHDWPITFSVGIGVFPRVPAGADRVVGYCEQLMRRVKAAGKNKVLVRVFDPDEIDSMQRTMLHVVH